MGYCRISGLFQVFLIVAWMLDVNLPPELREGGIAPNGPVGWIIDVRSPAFLKDATGKEIALTPKRHLVRHLEEGDLVRCGPGGYLKVQIGDKTKEIKESSSWFLIHWISSPDPEVVKAIESYGHLGGRDRMIESAIFAPAPGSAVRAQWLSFDWLREPGLGTVSLVLYNEFEKEIWRQNGIAGDSGHFISTGARSVLENYRDDRERRKFKFVIVGANHQRAESAFFLLSREEEKRLDRAVRPFDEKNKSLLQYIGRAYWFGQYGLCTEAAHEYEAALMLAPESQDLISATIQTEMCTGNLGRINELRSRLALLEGPA